MAAVVEAVVEVSGRGGNRATEVTARMKGVRNLSEDARGGRTGRLVDEQGKQVKEEEGVDGRRKR